MSNQPINKKDENTTQKIYNRVTHREMPQIPQQNILIAQKQQSINSNQQVNQFLIPNSQNQLQLAGQIKGNNLTPQIRQMNLQIKPTKPILHVPNQFISGFQKNEAKIPFKNDQVNHQMIQQSPIMMMNQPHQTQHIQHKQHNIYDQQWPQQKFNIEDQDFNNQIKIQMNNFGQNQQVNKDEDLEENFDMEQFARENGLDKEQIEQLLQTINQKDNYDQLEENENCDYDEQMALQYIAQQNLNQELAFTQDQLRQQFTQQEQGFYQQYEADEDIIVKPEELELLIAEGKIDPYFLEQYSQRLNCYPQTMLPYNAFQQQDQFARYRQFQQPIICQQSEIQPYKETKLSNNMVSLPHENVQFQNIKQGGMVGFPQQLDYSQELNYYQYVQQQQKPPPGIPALIEVIHPLHQLNHIDAQETKNKNFQNQLIQFSEQKNQPLPQILGQTIQSDNQINPEGLPVLEVESYPDSECQREYERQRDEYFERELRIFYKKMIEKLSKKQLDNITAQNNQICNEIDRVQRNILDRKKMKQNGEEIEQKVLRQSNNQFQDSQSVGQDASIKKKNSVKNNGKRGVQNETEERVHEGADTRGSNKIQPNKFLKAAKDEEINSSKFQSDFLFGEECDADSTFQSQFYGPNSPIDPNAFIQCVLQELAGHQSLSKWFKRFLPEDDEEDAKSMQRKYLLLRQTMQQNLDQNQKIELLSNAGLVDPKTGQPLTLEQIQAATTPEISEKIITSLKKDSLQSLITLLQNYGEVKQTKSVVEALNKYGQDIICVVEKYQQYVSYDLQNQMLAELKSKQKDNEQGSFYGNESDSQLAAIKKNFVEKLGRQMETLIQLIPTEIINNQRLILKKQNLNFQKDLLLGEKDDQGQFSSDDEAMTEQVGPRIRNKWLIRGQADETSMKDSEIDAKGLKKDETDSEIKSISKQDSQEENEEENEEQIFEQEEESVEEDWQEEKEKAVEVKPGRKRQQQIAEEVNKSSQEEESGQSKLDIIAQKPDNQIAQDQSLTRTKSLLTEFSSLWPSDAANLNKQEIKTFDNLRKQLKLEEDWQLFIKLFSLYIYGVIGFSTFVHLFEDKFGSKIKSDLRKELESLLPTRENHRRLQSDILKPWNDPENQKFTKIFDSSYYKIHDDLPLPICSAKVNPENNSFYQDFLNDKYLSLSKGSENFKFKVRNIHEDLIFKNEDDMYKLDSQIEMFRKCIDILQKEMEAFQSMTQQQRDLYEFPRQKLRPLMFYIEKKYSTSKDLLTIKPFQSKYLAILQQGFVRKLQELENLRLDQLSHFEDVYKKNFLKSLDHRSFHYKEFIKKFTQKLHQVSEIKKTALNNQQYLRRPIWQIVGGNSQNSIFYNSFGKFLKAPEMTLKEQNETLTLIINECGSNNLINNEASIEKYPHQILCFKDQRALQIATKLLCLHIRCSTIHHSNERIRLIAVLNDVMQNFICMQKFDVLDIQCRGSNDVAGGVIECLSSAHIDAILAQDSCKEKSYYNRRSSLTIPIQLQRTADELYESDKRSILNNKVQQQMRDSYQRQRQPTQNLQQEISMNYTKGSNEQSDKRILFAPTNFFIFFKYLHAIYERVLHSRQLIQEKIRLDISEMSSQEKAILSEINEETFITERYEYLLKGIFAISTHQNSTPQTTLSDLSPSELSFNISPYAITNMTMLNPAGISNHGPALLDHNKFEDFCRQLVGKHAFLIFHIEKLILQSIKQLQNMVTEPTSQKAIKLYKQNNFIDHESDCQSQFDDNQISFAGSKSPPLIHQNNFENKTQPQKHTSSAASPIIKSRKKDLTLNISQLNLQVNDPIEKNYLAEYCEENVELFSVLKQQQLIAQKLPSSKLNPKVQKKALQTNGASAQQPSSLISSSQSNFQVFRCCYLPNHHVLTFNVLDLNPFSLQVNQSGSNQLASSQQANQLYSKAMVDNYDTINQFIMQPISLQNCSAPLFLQKHIKQDKVRNKTQINQLEERICPVISSLQFEPFSEDIIEGNQKQAINPEMTDGRKANKLLQKRANPQQENQRGQNKRQRRT